MERRIIRSSKSEVIDGRDFFVARSFDQNAVYFGITDDVYASLDQLQRGNPTPLTLWVFIPQGASLYYKLREQYYHFHIRENWFSTDSVMLTDLTILAAQEREKNPLP